MKKVYAAGIAILAMLAVTACGNQIPELTEEEYAMVTEYAANKLLAYSGNYHSRLVDTSVPPAPTPTPTPIYEPVVSDEEDQEQTSEADAPESGNDAVQSGMAAPSLPIAQVMGLNGFDVSYTSFRFADSYPESDENPENMFFAMSATEGAKLLILNMDITNTSAEVAVLDTLSADAKYRVILNGQNAQNALVTMLEDDFTALQTEIAPGETVSAVVVAEVPVETVDSIQSVGLEVKSGDRKTVVTQ